MTAEKLANAILKKCDIYYGDALISKEAIIEKYLSFFADSSKPLIHLMFANWRRAAVWEAFMSRCLKLNM